MLPITYTASVPLRIGVLLAPPPVQLLDIAPVDLFHMLSKEYLLALPILPGPIKNLAFDQIEILYIADKSDSDVTTVQSFRIKQSTTYTSDPDPAAILPSTDHGILSFAPLTANMNIQVTTSVLDEQVQPGKLSILVIPGPDPSSILPDTCHSFIRSHAFCGTTDIITICTGIYPACNSGICDGNIVTAPRGLLPELRTKFKNVKAFEDKRWSKCYLPHTTKPELSRDEQSGKAATQHIAGENRSAELWTAAGITNGHDCIAAYLKAHFDQDLAEIVCRMADVGDRPKDYDTGQVAEGVWWMTRIIRAAVKSLWR